ncbi:acyl-CoA reductase-like NAD-dependent aldehyde dehydrogenase [Neobacillus niacini]|uniref:hypothetical protein n=1 Tax=Neobacillus niacini TaxID=86668 RepID=UPI002862E983|nr:hypothetical protein [Neobacillus niacini]MDR7076156.1 acyl-CoA reductase-like NAD-dependent aldehyde dehydrogenase [Neobacillus niacini]
MNTYGGLDPSSPFDGCNESGISRENGAKSINMFKETIGWHPAGTYQYRFIEEFKDDSGL